MNQIGGDLAMRRLPKAIIILVVMTILSLAIGGLITFAASYHGAYLSDPPNPAAFAATFEHLYWLNLPSYLIISFGIIFIGAPFLWCYLETSYKSD